MDPGFVDVETATAPATPTGEKSVRTSVTSAGTGAAGERTAGDIEHPRARPQRAIAVPAHFRVVRLSRAVGYR